jgi:hypothetical protein
VEDFLNKNCSLNVPNEFPSCSQGSQCVPPRAPPPTELLVIDHDKSGNG